MFNNSFENQRAENKEMIDEAYEKALSLDDPVDMDSFADLYKDVDSDLKYVSEMEHVFEQSQSRESQLEEGLRKLAKIFEIIISQQMELSNWLGETAMTNQVSKYDDYKNGVDTVVEFDEPEGASHLALAIDVTSGHELTRKFERIKSEIEKEELTKIKYFVSENLGFRGEKNNVPRVVIGADRLTILDLMEKWLDKNQEALAEHIMQVIIIEEMIYQLKVFVSYAESLGKNKIADIYQRALVILERIKKDKDLQYKTLVRAHDDEVFGAIKYNLNSFEK